MIHVRSMNTETSLKFTNMVCRQWTHVLLKLNRQKFFTKRWSEIIGSWEISSTQLSCWNALTSTLDHGENTGVFYLRLKHRRCSIEDIYEIISMRPRVFAPKFHDYFVHHSTNHAKALQYDTIDLSSVTDRWSSVRMMGVGHQCMH